MKQELNSQQHNIPGRIFSQKLTSSTSISVSFFATAKPTLDNPFIAAWAPAAYTARIANKILVRLG